LERLLKAARRIADPSDELGRRARAVLPGSTGLSEQNVELALTEILETHPPETELAALISFVPPAPRAHVVLAANVFVAAHRAVALALAQSPRVSVRPSRREPEFARLLQEGSDGAFDIVESLAPEPDDHVWAYGADVSLAEIRAALKTGVMLHAHGSGFGVAVVEMEGPNADALAEEMTLAARSLARDVVPFDQRGCLSPRICIVPGDAAVARAFAETLATALAEAERDVPLGALSDDERAEITRWRDTMQYAAELLPAGPGWVSLQLDPKQLVVPPVGRNVAVVSTHELEKLLVPATKGIAAVGVAGRTELSERVARALPAARLSALRRMQRPDFDGPVDHRPSSRVS